jgi:hypothetical protein
VTDTASPITEPHPSPMFATGAQPTLAPNTEPHPSPIFDTGPHPEPLRSGDEQSLEWDSDEWESAGSASAEQDVDSSAAPLDYERAPVWDAGSPQSEPELARIARGLESAADADADVDADAESPVAPEEGPQAFSEYDNVDTDAFLRSVTGHLRPIAVTAQPVVVPGAFQFIKRWKFALVVAVVWVLAAAAGAGFYYWWYTALDKTLPVFGILMYLMVCMVASMLVSMVPDRPQITALAIALMSAPLASTAAAAVLHGAYFFEWVTRPIVG